MFRWLFGRKRIVWSGGKPPLETFVVGNVEAAVWVNRDDKGPVQMIGFSRIDGNDERSKAFFVKDLADVRSSGELAKAWILKNKNIRH